MADEVYRAPEGHAKPWSGNYDANRQWWSVIHEADNAAMEAGAGKMDLVLEHLRAAADIKGVAVWELVQSLTPDERDETVRDRP